ncbi:MAG: DUF885 domain-containing protein, partial [Gammaproteobacteria bacterium]|nr:DUF885 domain-containing protein [Gammaproteobacteria bacterium]
MIGSKLVKRVLKWLGATIGVLVLALSVLAVNAFYFRPFSIRVFFETAFLKIALEDPELLSSMRLLEQAGLTFHNDDLTDISPAQTMRVNGMFEQDLAMLRSYDRASLDGQDALSYDILEWFLQNQAEGIPFTWHSYPVNQMHGEQNGLPNFMANIHHVGGVRDARDYVARLSKFDSKFDQLLEDLRLREEKGILPPRFTVEKVLDEMRGFRGRPARDNVLFTTFVERLDKLDGVDEEERSELERQVETEIERTVYPAYDGLIAYFERLREKATTDHGVWKLPDGDAYYDHMLRRNTTTSLTADQIHELGLSEVARIHAEMDAILAAEGYTEGTIAERMNRLNEEERFLYPNTDDGRRRILEDFRAIIEEIHTGMHAYFGRLPKSPVEVQRVPEFRQAGAAGAYYMSPSMDGARPGVFYANLRDLKEHPRFG